ncbi:MAG: VIT1/CCC1 transporter family protein [Steroidobacteraceae bacterium]
MAQEWRRSQRHFAGKTTWLRAAVLGANDGIVSLASLLVGVAATHVSRTQALIVGVAGLVGGAMSMAAGEFVSVSSQADSERSDLERERRELAIDEPAERAELAGIYRQRGLAPQLAEQVAAQLMRHDALGAHARDELGLSMSRRARPLQAALASAASFAGGALLPLLLVVSTPAAMLIPVIAISSLVLLAVLGSLAARAGGAPIGPAALRVTFWGALAMAVTATVGSLFGSFA